VNELLEHPQVQALIALALAEDLGAGDVTTEATVPAATTASARLVAREAGVIAGLPLAAEVFRRVDERLVFAAGVADGDSVAPGAVVAEISGPARGILTGERLALNFLQHLSGIATRTRRFVDLVAGTQARILDTRKTVPGLRVLAKYAVRMGGGENHRQGLFDGVLIKDNHLAAAGGVLPAVECARAAAPAGMKVEVEVETLAQTREALAAGADILLLDNMSPALLREAVALCQGKALTEASGGVTEETVAAIAATGVDFISVGALTHSVRALDLALDFDD